MRRLENANYSVPALKLDHLFKMSDHTGIFQHAIYNVPNYHEGYCTDDNARAFIFTVLLCESGETPAGSGQTGQQLPGIPLVRLRRAIPAASATS